MEQEKLTKAQENKETAFEDIKTTLDNNSDIVNAIPEFANSKSEFSNVISGIRIKAVRKATVTKGATQNKTVKRVELETCVLENAAALFVYGKKRNNEIIKAIAKINQSELDRLRDTEVGNKASAVLESMEDKEAELPAFGRNADDIGKLRTCISDYKDSSVSKSSSTTEKTVINISLTELFKKGMDILETEIDKFVDSLKNKERDFYNSYYAVRTIKNLGVRHKKLLENQQKTN